MRTFEKEDPCLEGIGWVPDSGPCSGVYVIDHGRVLIDAGNMVGLVDHLEEMAPLDKVERLLLTHTHFDHVGGMAEIYQRTAPDVLVHPVAREYARLLRPPFPEFFQALEDAGKIHSVLDEQEIDGIGLKALHVPGHTAGDLCFYHAEAQALFSGDAVLPYQLRFSAILSKPDDFCGGRMQDKLQSLRRLLRLPVRHLFPGHGEPVLHKGSHQIKIALVTLYQSLYENLPEKAWLLMAQDLAAAGQPEEAEECLKKARALAPTSEEVDHVCAMLGRKA
ncbi:MAG: MBL fold metallo-hydrolase [Desulfosoma sp.]